MKKDPVKTAQEILKAFGGKENVISATHCATRLRVEVKDASVIDEEGMKEIQGVAGYFSKSGQHQVILGTGFVNKVCAEFQKLTGEMPLVLHGGTGIPADMIKKAIDLGVSKINVNTECQLSFAAATRKYIEEGKDQQGKGYDPRKLLAPGFEAIKATVKEKMELFGSVGQA